MSEPVYVQQAEHTCPRCDYKVDRLSGVETEHKPGAGDLAICVRCGFIEEFVSDDLTRKELSFNSMIEAYAASSIDLSKISRLIMVTGELYRKYLSEKKD